jgi:hypothetical protein
MYSQRLQHVRKTYHIHTKSYLSRISNILSTYQSHTVHILNTSYKRNNNELQSDLLLRDSYKYSPLVLFRPIFIAPTLSLSRLLLLLFECTLLSHFSISQFGELPTSSNPLSLHCRCSIYNPLPLPYPLSAPFIS